MTDDYENIPNRHRFGLTEPSPREVLRARRWAVFCLAAFGLGVVLALVRCGS